MLELPLRSLRMAKVHHRDGSGKWPYYLGPENGLHEEGKAGPGWSQAAYA
jgi:hypothetical protein